MRCVVHLESVCKKHKLVTPGVVCMFLCTALVIFLSHSVFFIIYYIFELLYHSTCIETAE